MDVDVDGGLMPGYKLKLNSYDLAVDIELYDATQRLRLEHPEVKTVVLTSALDRTFCAGANIKMLGSAGHGLKVNFCKFTNETRNAMEEAGRESGQRYLAAVNGAAAGGGFELALATDYIMLSDDGNSSVAMPEVPLLAVLPGTGGLTRLTDKRKVRRDLADVFCTLEEGVRGSRAVEWRLVDETVRRSRFEDAVRAKALEMAADSDRPSDQSGVELTPLVRGFVDRGVDYEYLGVEIDHDLGLATLTVRGPEDGPPEKPAEIDASTWPLALARQLDDAILHLRLNEPAVGMLVFRSEGDAELVAAHDAFLHRNRDQWLVREVILYWRRTLKRLDVSSRTMFALIEPGSCYTGLLTELVLAADRSYMLEGPRESDSNEPASIRLTEMNFGPLPMPNGLSRLATRFYGHEDELSQARALLGTDLDARAAERAGLVTFAFDEIDWDEELRMAVEERASFSSDSLTGMEANLRFPGPETMESKIFGRLSAWQNWIFQRPNAAGETGALQLYGTGARPTYDQDRV